MWKTIDAEPIVGSRISPARAFPAREESDAKGPFPSRVKEDGHKAGRQTLEPFLIAPDNFGSGDAWAHEGDVEGSLLEGVLVNGHDSTFTDTIFKESATGVLPEKGRIISFKWVAGGERGNEDVTAGRGGFRPTLKKEIGPHPAGR